MITVFNETDRILRLDVTVEDGKTYTVGIPHDFPEVPYVLPDNSTIKISHN